MHLSLSSSKNMHLSLKQSLWEPNDKTHERVADMISSNASVKLHSSVIHKTSIKESNIVCCQLCYTDS